MIRFVPLLAVSFALFCGSAIAEPKTFPLESISPEGVSLIGKADPVPGVKGKALSLVGRSLLSLNDSRGLAAGDPGFTLVFWVNPYNAGNGGQQILAGKNQYSLDRREWSLMIDSDGVFRLYVRQKGWKTAAAEKRPEPGHWHQVAVRFEPGNAQLWVNGEKAGDIELSRPVPATEAPITLGGIDDGGSHRQMFSGALDEVQYFDRPLEEEKIAALYQPNTATLPIPEPPKRFALWTGDAEVPAADDLPQLEDVAFHVIKKWDKPRDGYTFLHGVGLAWHKGKLYASIGHNKGAENTVTEEAQYRVSPDGGKTWGPLQVIDAGGEENLAVSHGVFLSHEGKLWAFQGAYYGRMKNIHTRAYTLDEERGEWVHHGTVVGDGFWAMNQPVRMEDGNWIMPGGSFGLYSSDKVFPAAVAISDGDDFTKWKMVSLPVDPEIQRMWGESSLFVDGSTVYNIARYGGGAQALVSVSKDYGQTWSATEISNLPMATSKPAAGVLSTGQRYLVCTTAGGNGGKRTPFTIAVSKPGENAFSRVFVIRRSQNPEHPGESADYLALSYPYAVEHEGKLYVGYSNNGGRKANHNSAELAVIPVATLVTQ